MNLNPTDKHWFHVKHLFGILLILPAFVFGQKFSTTTFTLKSFPVFPKKDTAILNPLSRSQKFFNLTSNQKEWFYWTNVSRQKPRFFYDSVVESVLKIYPELVSTYTLSLKKDLYKTSPLPAILPNKKLLVLSQDHANDLASNKSELSHNSSNGQSFQQRMIKNEINRCAAENLSYGPANTVMALVLLYIDEGLPDVGHRKNLLSPTYVEMGIGISNYSNNNVLVVQDLACSQNL